MAEQETPKGEAETFSKDQVQAMIDEAVKGLASKNDELLTEVKTFKSKAKDEADAARKAAEEAAKKSGDVESLEKSWGEKYATRESELSAIIQERDTAIARLTAGNAAKSIASELAVKGSEWALEQLIAPRLGVEVVEGQAKVIVKDAAGQRSAASLDDFKKEIRADERFKSFLQGTKATGAGGVGSDGGAGTGKTIAASELEKMTPQQKFAYFKANPGVSVQT